MRNLYIFKASYINENFAYNEEIKEDVTVVGKEKIVSRLRSRNKSHQYKNIDRINIEEWGSCKTVEFITFKQSNYNAAIKNKIIEICKKWRDEKINILNEKINSIENSFNNVFYDEDIGKRECINFNDGTQMIITEKGITSIDILLQYCTTAIIPKAENHFVLVKTNVLIPKKEEEENENNK